MPPPFLQNLALTLALGLQVGLERQRAVDDVARFRLGDTRTGITTGALAVLLHFRDPLHDLADRIQPGEIDALIRLVIIALVLFEIGVVAP